MEELELKARIVRGEDGSVDFYFAKDYDNDKHFGVIKSYLDNAKEVQLQQIHEHTVQMDEYMKRSNEKCSEYMKRSNEQYAEFMKSQTEQMKMKMSKEIIY